MAILRNDTTVRSADGQTTSAIVTAANIGSYGISTTSTYYIGTTQNVFNRSSASQTLTGVSIDGNAATVTNGVYTTGAQTIGGTKTFSDGVVVNSATYNTFSKPSTTNYQTVTLFGSASGGLFLTTDNAIIGTGAYYNNGWIATATSGRNLDFASGNFTFTAFSGATVGGAASFGTIAQLTSAGVFSTTGDFRAPIFYDSNNTAYYIDPASTSVLNKINLNSAGVAAIQWRAAGVGTISGGFPFYNNASYGSINIEVSDNDTGGLVIDNEGVTVYGAADNGQLFRTIDEDVYQSNSNVSASTTFWINQGLDGGGTIRGSFNATADFRAPIFYDSNDTAYYCDPNGTSRLANLRVYSSFDTASSDVYANMRVIRDAAYTDGLYIGFNNAGTGTTKIFGGGASTGELTKYSNYTLEPGSFRSPIFYDSDNTNYYCDPASTSVLSTINTGTFIVNGSMNWTANAAVSTGNKTIGYNLWQGGKKLYADEDFNSGNNGIAVYNNSGGTALTLTRTALASAPNSSGYVLRMSYSTATSNGTSPGFGGFYFANGTKANAVYVARFVANIPSGRGISFNSNAYGTNSTSYWLTNNAGTGKWEEYAYLVICGDSGTFSSTNYFSISGGSDVSFTWDIASATVFDITNKYEQMNRVYIGEQQMNSPIFYDSNNTSYYVDPASTSNLNALTMAGIITTVSSGTAINFSGQSDSFGYNATSGQGTYIKGTGSTYIYGGGVFYDGSAIRTLLHSNNYAGYSTFSGSVTSTYGSFATPGIIIGDAQYGFYTSAGNLYYKSASTGVHYWRNIANSANVVSFDNTGNITNSGYINASSYIYTSTYFQTGGNLIYPSGYGATQTLQVGNSANNNWIAGISLAPGGLVTVAGDVRSPIYYDANNTAYYVDPANTSRIDSLIFGGGILINNAATAGDRNLKIKGSSSTNVGIALYDSTDAFRCQLYAESSNYGFLDGLWAGWDIQKTIDGNLYLNGNTTYYLNPPSTTYLNVLNVGGATSGTSFSGTSISIAGNSSSADPYGTVAVTEPANASNYSYYGLTRQANIGAGFGLTGTTGALGFGANAFWFGSATSGAGGVMGSAYIAFNSSTFAAVGTVDATQFRDRDDTTYYLDPASTTLSLKTRGYITITNASAPANLAMLNIGYNGSGETRAIDIQGGWSANENKSITFNHASGSTNIVAQINAQHNSPGSRLRWGKLYHGGDSSTYTMELISESTTSAYLTVAGSVRSPIFYDTNDTNYYLDPASTSRINTTRIGNINVGSGTYLNTITPIGDTNINLSAPSGAFYFDTFPRMPGFYDSDNTSYYVDPASTSNLNGLTVAGGNATIYRDLTVNGGTGGSYGNRIIVQGTATTYTLQDNAIRPTVYLTGAYPVVTLNHTVTNNANHGPTIQFAFNGLTTGGSTSRQIVIGANGTATYLDFGFSGGGSGTNSDYNPHNGIAGYAGLTPMRLFSNGLLLGSTGTYPNHIISTSYALDVRGTGYSNTDFRAPIFYDSDNTAYYVNPASTSNLNGLTVAATISGNISGNSATATNVAWTGITQATRTNYDLTFQPPNSGYAGFTFNTTGGVAGSAGYFLVRGTSDSDVYTAEGITLVADAGWLTLAQRTTASRGVKIMTGTTSAERLKVTTAGDFQIVNGNSFTYNGNVVLHAGNYTSYTLPIGGSWYGANLPGTRWNGMSVNGGEIVFGRDLPAVGQMGILVDGCYIAGENNGFWSLGSSNDWGTRRGFYWDGSYLNFTTGSAVALFNDARATIFYDSNDTTYYIDPASTSLINSLKIAGGIYNNGSVSDDDTFGIFWESSYSSAYAIFREPGAWQNPYPDLRIAFHTGIKLGANSGYNGIRFYNDYDMATQVMSVNNNGDALGANNVYVNNSLVAGSSLRAPIFYDTNNTAYYIDPASSSRVDVITSNDDYTYGWFRSYTSGYGIYNQVTGQHFYSDDVSYWNVASSSSSQGIRLRTGGYGGTVRGYFYADTNNDVGILNNAGNWRLRVVGGDYGLADGSSMRAQIFYDSNNTGYYIDAASTSVLSSLTIAADANLELYKSQTVDMSNTTTYSTSNYYPVTIPVLTEGCIIQIQNNLNSNVPSWSTHGAGFTLNLKWRTNASGWGTTDVRRYIEQYHERFANQTICGGITQMTNSSIEVVWLRGGGQYLFKFSRNLTATAQSATFTSNSQSVSPTSSAQNAVWDSVSGYEKKYNNTTISTDSMYTPVLYDWNNTGYYCDPASTSNLVGLTVANTITGSVSGSSGSCTGNAATATRTSGQSGYPHAGTGMWAFYNWGGSDGGTSAPSASTYTTGLSVGSNPGDQAYGFQIANNMWNTGLWTRNYNSGFGSWIRLLDSTNYVGYSAFTGNVDGTQFRDANDTAYYLDPAGTSNLNKFSTLTMSYNDMNSMHVNSPYVNRYNGSSLYRNGTMGYGTTDCNVMFSNWGSGFIDSWSSPANAPGGSTHYVGLQGFHYNHQNNSQAYGFQMLCAGEANNRFFWRSAWPDLRSWVEMIHSGNIGSQTVATAGSCTGNSATVTINYNNDSNSTYQMLWGAGNNVYGTAGVYLNPSTDALYANLYYDANDSAYYLDPNSTSNLLLVKTRNTFGQRIAVTASSPITIDTQYSLTQLTLTGSISSMSFSNIQADGIVHMWTIVTVGNATAYTITWPAAVKWPGGTAPTVTTTNTKRDIYQFVTYDGGTNIYAIIVGQNL